MSIELKQAAQQALNALDEATTYTGSPSWSPSMTDECIAAASELRTALSQQPDNAACKSVRKRLAAQQPATGEPVAWMASYVDPVGNDHVYVTSHHYLAVENDMHGEPKPLYTHPAPSVPADVARDAERYRWLREQNESLESFTFYVGCGNGPDDDGSVEWVGADLDATIDAAMLAAKDTK